MAAPGQRSRTSIQGTEALCDLAMVTEAVIARRILTLPDPDHVESMCGAACERNICYRRNKDSLMDVPGISPLWTTPFASLQEKKHLAIAVLWRYNYGVFDRFTVSLLALCFM
jgi:hypothetical protein